MRILTAQSPSATQAGLSSALEKQAPDDLFTEIHDSVTRRAYEIFERDGGEAGRDWEDWFRAEADMLHPAHLELKEAEGAFYLKMEVPGFASNNLEIKVEPRHVSIAGRRETKEEEKKGKMIRSELSSNQFLRGIDLPTDIDTAGVGAGLKDGVLTMFLPKAPHATALLIVPKPL
jgi:HSP20 family molecular chaperone IbpA